MAFIAYVNPDCKDLITNYFIGYTVEKSGKETPAGWLKSGKVMISGEHPNDIIRLVPIASSRNSDLGRT